MRKWRAPLALALLVAVSACGTDRPSEVGATPEETRRAASLEGELETTGEASDPAPQDSGVALMSPTSDPEEESEVAPQPDSASTMAGHEVIVDVLVNDGADVELVEAFDAVGGTATVVETTVVFTPARGFSGLGGFTYAVRGTGGDVGEAVVEVMVIATRADPNAGDDTAFTTTNTSVEIDVLANDSDPDPGDTLSLQSVSSPANGTATITSSATILYSPDAGFFGTDTFTYVVRSSSADEKVVETATATVVVTVNGPPDAVDDAASTLEDQPVSVDVQANDSDPEGEALTTVSATDPDNGSVTVEADGTITYTPDSGFSGTDTFTYTIEDPHGQSDTATVTVTVNGAPDAVDDVFEPEDCPISNDQVENVLLNDSDPDGDPITLISVTAGANINIDSFTPGGEVQFDWLGGGDGTFTYTIEDSNGQTDTATATIPTCESPD